MNTTINDSLSFAKIHFFMISAKFFLENLYYFKKKPLFYFVLFSFCSIFACMNHESDFVFSPVGDVSEHFSEISELSSSGFNIILRAKRAGQWWMLKALKFGVRQNPTFLHLQQKEYDILCRLQHPGIVKVEALEDVEGYGRCIVMEWIEGETLAEWLTQGHSRLERKQVARQLLQAVEFVHDQQVVHRDLKPSNIMITTNGSIVKLIDFGLSDSDSYAILKSPAGTDGYVAPEQMRNSEPDVRNDIYSMGVILREMNLGFSYRCAAKRCLRPLSRRYPNVHALRMAIQSLHHWMVAAFSILVFLLLGVAGGIIYNKVMKPQQMYDVVAQFTIGNLEFKSWGGGLVTVRAANDRDVCVEIPATASYRGVTYRVDEVEDSAFADCEMLRQVVLPDNPHLHVMKHLFAGCHQLQSICFRSKVPPALGNSIWKVKMTDVFRSEDFNHIILFVPKGSLSAYRHSPWGRFLYIREYD